MFEITDKASEMIRELLEGSEGADLGHPHHNVGRRLSRRHLGHGSG